MADDKRKIILDVDTGTDDAMAILLAERIDAIDLTALTVTHGNQPLACTLENTLRVTELLGRDIPVYAGCPEPMVQLMAPGRRHNQVLQTVVKVIDGKEVHIHDPYLPLPPATRKPRDMHAVSYLVETLRGSDQKITLVSVGPPTNIGMALRMAPDIARYLDEIVVMGGGVDMGNRTSAAEMNFYMDPEASQLLVKADTKVTLFPLNATMSALFTKQDGEAIIALGNPVARFFGQLITGFVDRCALLDIGADGVAIHDALCILYLVDPAIVTDLRHENCDVDFGGGIADGALIVDARGYMPKTRETYIAYRVDKDRVMRHLLNILA